jgi:hypothetical protein
MPAINQLVDPATVLPYFIENGLETTLLQKCNSQQYKYIDGYGEGYLLMRDFVYNNNVSNGRISSDILGGPTRSLSVVDVYYFDHNSTPNTSTRMVIVHTAEEKFRLSKKVVLRNYNVLNRRSYVNLLIEIVAPDALPKTLEQIINDISGLTCDYNGYAVYPYDVFIQGMDVCSAIDYLCAAHGLLWSYDGTTLTIHDGTSIDVPDNIKIADNINNKLDPSLVSVSVVFPVLNCCLSTPQQFYASDTDIPNTPGETLVCYYPFFQACFNATSQTLENGSVLNARRDTLVTRFKAIDLLDNNITTYEWFKTVDLNDTPKSFRVIYADYGAGPRTILVGRDYPYLEKPYQEIVDRQAKNWVGYLAYTYKGDAVAGFWVTPAFGIDGKLPNIYGSDPGIWVVNLYKWNYGAADAAIRVEWDCVNYRWIPLQQEYKCPPSENPPPPPTSPGDQDPTWEYE